MSCKKKYSFWLLAAVTCAQCIMAQTSTPPAPADSVSISEPNRDTLYRIRHIIITGNRKTKEKIILREIPIQEGDHYSVAILAEKFETARRQLMNTALFNSVIVAAKNFDGNDVDVSVILRERWYLFPFPYFRPVDRNLNQWLVEQKASLRRVNYGGKLLYNNVTGINDKLRFYAFGGYTKQLSLSYDRLYIDKNLRWGMKFFIAAGKNREMNYNTINDKQVFVKDTGGYVHTFFSTQAELTYRRAIKTRHSFGIGYTIDEVKDTIVELNPTYFDNGRKSVRYPEVYYTMTYYDQDYIPYPTRGYAAQVSFSKKGLNSPINLWQLSVRGLGSWHLFKKTFLSADVFGSIKVPFKQPYFTQRFLGYQDVFLQGYEYYVIDGVAGGYVKGAITHELLNFKIRIPPMKRGKEVQYIPFRIYGKVFGNAGYVHNPEPGLNDLSNRMLYSGGFGIDILTFYDVTFKLEWTFNQLGQNGIFLHRKTFF